MVSDRFFKKERSWRTEERCTALLSGSVLVLAVHAPDCRKDLDVYETFVKDVTNVLWEGRRAEAKKFYIVDDLNVELGLLCTYDEHVEELREMYGPLRWQGCDDDQGGFKKLMWYEIMKEFNSKATSTWSDCDDDRCMAFTHRQFEEDGNGRTSQLGCILGPKMASE